MSDTNQVRLLEEVLDIMGRGEAPWQQSISDEDRLAAEIEPANVTIILEQFERALNGHPELMEVAGNRLNGDLFSSAMNAKPTVGLNTLLADGTFDQMLDVA